MTAQGMSAFGENSRSEVEGEARQPGRKAMRQTINRLSIILVSPPTLWGLWIAVTERMI